MADRIAEIWGTRTPYSRDGLWPVRVDQALAEGIGEDAIDHWVQSACVLCSNGCACDIAVKDGVMVCVRGRAGDLVNHGRLGPKGLFASWQGMAGRDRLTRPLIRQDGELVETDWETAMGRIVDRSRHLLDQHGPLSHAFYTSGQLFLEEYYALGIIGKAGVGTPHMDGNTRLCTATAASALKETFGADGQPGSYADIDHCDALFLYGHNMAETQTVLWARVLDRLAGPDRPRLVCVDPRDTEVARRADVHLAVRPGTNLALMNALVHEVVAGGWWDEEYVAAHAIELDMLRETVAPWTPERAAETCGVRADDIREAARIFGTSPRVLSTVLQGFYQSAQATAASCQVNNLHLLRGMLGRPGCGLLQMNGQPTAQNNRECGADGDLPGFRNWENPAHIEELAGLWDVDPMTIPHWAPPTHAMQIFRYAEQGSVQFLWISATNPAVSLPDLPRIRRILARPELFVVVQDLYLTETAQAADVVLPAAGWGEKLGTFTNTDRTVHLSEQAVDPPGEARSDLAIFLDYSRRMGFTTRSGRPLLDWSGPEDGFDAWRECSRGRPCDYSGITYERLRGGSGIQWPCNDEHPDGTVRLYGDAVFPTAPDYCENFGHDLLTGANVEPEAYRASAPGGRAFLKSAEYHPPTRSRTTGTRCASPPGAPPTTSTPGPRPAAPVPSTGQPRPPGWNSAPRTANGWASRRATWCGSRPGGDGSRCRRGSGTSGRAQSSRPSTTATGRVTEPPASTRPPPTSSPSPSGTRSPSSRCSRMRRWWSRRSPTPPAPPRPRRPPRPARSGPRPALCRPPPAGRRPTPPSGSAPPRHPASRMRSSRGWALPA